MFRLDGSPENDNPHRTPRPNDHAGDSTQPRWGLRRADCPQPGAAQPGLGRAGRGLQRGDPPGLRLALGQLGPVDGRPQRTDPSCGAGPRGRVCGRPGRPGMETGDAVDRPRGDRVRTPGRRAGQFHGGRGGQGDAARAGAHLGRPSEAGAGTDPGRPRGNPGGGVPAPQPGPGWTAGDCRAREEARAGGHSPSLR